MNAIEQIRNYAAEILRLADGMLPAPPVTLPPLPLKAEWEANMVKFGHQLHDFFKTETNPERKQYACLYDAQYVFFQIADYTRDLTWNASAQLAEKAYRDYYVLPNNGRVQAWYNLTHGLTEDFLRTADAKSKQAVLLIAKNAAYSQDWVPATETLGVAYAREKAYVLQSYLQAERLGQPLPARSKLLLDQILDDVQAVAVRRDSVIKPFFLGLEGSALIEYHAAHPDPRIPPALKLLADAMWPLWREEAGGMLYTDRPDGEPDDDMKPAPDLNMLILPVYWEVYKQTKDDSYRVKADKLFVGCVSRPNLADGKQFNQCYRESIRFVRERTK